jgi:hypothetical protein
MKYNTNQVGDYLVCTVLAELESFAASKWLSGRRLEIRSNFLFETYTI